MKKLIVLTLSSTSGNVAPEPVGGLNEVLDPIRAMLNAREARGYIEIDRAVAATKNRRRGRSTTNCSKTSTMTVKPCPAGHVTVNCTRIAVGDTYRAFDEMLTLTGDGVVLAAGTPMAATVSANGTR